MDDHQRRRLGYHAAAIEGAGVENRFGVNIVLPFEQSAVDIIEGDPKLAAFRYFFTRKLFFVKEADAFAAFPADSARSTRASTSDADPDRQELSRPDRSARPSGSTYWDGWKWFATEELGAQRTASPTDSSLTCTPTTWPRPSSTSATCATA